MPKHKTIKEIQLQIDRLNEKYFDSQTYADVPFITISLAGEVGEVCNEIKKISRGSDPKRHVRELSQELADVFVYLVMLARVMDIDLDEEIKDRLHTIERRGRNGYYDR
jgi:NTP pyrophosphatase (non-canonical NTP hydrolase)